MRLFEGTPFDIPPTCDRCGRLESECDCPPPTPPARPLRDPGEQNAIVRTEKRKKGKTVTIVDGLLADENDFPQLLTVLKNVCGAGGTIRDNQIEIQGKHTERIAVQLRKSGYRVSTR